MILTTAAHPGLALLLLAAALVAAEPQQAPDPLVGTWRVVSYPTGEGDLLKRHGRAPGPPPPPETPLTGWSYLTFHADGTCALMYPERAGGHRRSAWRHDEDNFATWRIDRGQEPWRIDLGSVACPERRTVKTKDPATGKDIMTSEVVLDDASGLPRLRLWRYPGILRLDGDLLTLIWHQNHRLLPEPPEEQRPVDFAGLPGVAFEPWTPPPPGPDGKSHPRRFLPGGISCLIAQRFSTEPLPIPDQPRAEEALPKKQ